MLDDDGDDRDDCKRKTRNLSEKKRRDQFNTLVNELSALISSNNRKMDKSTVLRSTISYLKNHNEISDRSRVNEIQEDWKPSFLSNEEFTHLILEALDGFIMVLTSSGRINYASESITSLLGHLPTDLLKTSIYEITNDVDRPNLFSFLSNPKGSPSGPMAKSNGEALFLDHAIFGCHVRRGNLDFREDITYEFVQFTGYFKSNVKQQELDNRFGLSTDDSDSRSVFICTGRLQTPQLIRDMSVVDSYKSEFTSRHSLEWKFLFLDHRAPPIIGYLPFEVLGTSGYDYYHFDDLEKVVNCHESLMQKGEGTSCYYRFLTKGQQWIWLQTRFYITYHQWNSKPEFVVCTHRVVSSQDVFNSLQKEPEYCNPVNSAKITESFETLGSNEYVQHGESYTPNPCKKRSSKYKYSLVSDTSGYKKRFNKISHNANISTNRSDSASLSAKSLMSIRSSVTHKSASSLTIHSTKLNQRSHTSEVPNMISQPLPQYHQLQPQLPQNFQPIHHQPEQHIVQYSKPQQFLAVPVPSVISFPAIQPIAAPQEIGIMIAPNQSQMQDQNKHEELKQMIKLQKEELRRVSEQLVMARYSLLPPLINVSVPYNGIEQGANIVLNEVPEVHYAQNLVAVQPPRQMVEHHQNIQGQNNFIPMQMSQHQAQLLFSSSDIINQN